MANTYVQRVSDTSNIFRVQVIDDEGNTAYKNVAISDVQHLNSTTQAKVESYLLRNAASLETEDLKTGATNLAKEEYAKATEQKVGTYYQNGAFNTYESNEPTTWDRILDAGADLLGISYNKPSAEPSLVSSVTSGNKSTIAQLNNKSEKKITPYSEINGQKDTNLSLKDVIGGSDMSVFFLMSFYNYDPENMALPEEARERDFIMLEMDNVLSITYSIMREKSPVRACGSINPLDIIPGLRTISGSIAFTIYADDVLAYLRGIIQERMSKIDNKFNDYLTNMNNKKANGTAINNPTGTTTQQAIDDAEQKQKDWKKYRTYMEWLNKTKDKGILLDSLPPFHIMVMGVNERGTFSKLLLKNISVIDENQYIGTQQPIGMNKVTFTCTDIVPMAKFTNNSNVICSVDSVGEQYINGNYNVSYNVSTELAGSTVISDLNKDLNSKYADNTVQG